MSTRPRLPAHAWPLAALLVLAGCSRQHSNASSGDAPEAGAARLVGPDLGSPSGVLGRGRGGSFYPLALGNQWNYSMRWRSTLITDAGAQPPEVVEYPWVVSITGMAVSETRSYFLQHESDARYAAPGPMFMLREDRSGLYLVDNVLPAKSGTRAVPGAAAQWRASVEPAIANAVQSAAVARAADVIATRLDLVFGGGMGRPGSGGGPDLGEISMLRYPLRPGARWVVRDSPRFTRAVIGRETVHLPAGVFDSWKLRGDSELFGGTDRLHLWYARAGLLRIRFHTEAEATDNAGNIVGRVILDQDQVLTSLSLHSPNDPHTLGN